MHFSLLAEILDPFVSLALWVDNQRPSPAVEDEDTVVN